MAFIIETTDPFQPLVGMKKHSHPGGITIREWLELTYPGFVEFENPTICLLNGLPLMRSDWGRKIEKKDIVNFVAVVGYEWVVVIIVVLLIAVLVVTLTMKTPTTPGELPASSPVFSVQGKVNAVRLGEPIECNYGRNRIYPSYAARPFFKYQDNDQFLHSLLCIGQGVYDIETINIGDTSIDSFEEVEYEVLEPGELPTLFPTNVITSIEVGGQTLYAPNQDEYVDPGWIGPFATNPPGTEVNRLEIDFVLPKGLYKTDKKGRFKFNQVDFEMVYRRIDDAGAPLTSYSAFFNITSNFRLKTTTPVRFTGGKNVTIGRYEIRARRTSNTVKPIYGADQLVWEGMRGFVTGDEPNYGNVTLLAIKMRATNNLNTRTQEKFNVVATRKLPIRDGSSGGWSEPVPTRSVVWALVDIFRATYGGRVTDDNFYDWENLEALDVFYAYRDEYFDWTFRDAITVWEAARTVARVGRGVPLLSGSLITMRRDGPLEVPVTLFNPDNIVKDSFQWDIKLWEPGDFDSVSIEYTEPATGYKQENVLCTLPGGTTDHPNDVRIPGIGDREQAYREGLFLLASERYLRENITFETGMEGFIPSYGDLVYVAHDVPRWAQSGYILEVEEASGNQFVLFVSEPLRFEESVNYQILLRGKKGEILGPFDAEEMSNPNHVLVTIDETVDFLLGGKNEPMLFLFGVIEQEVKKGKVVKLEPQGGERVRITLVNYAEIIHTFDDLEAPALVIPPFPDDPDIPVIASLTLARLPGPSHAVNSSWTPAPGAIHYVHQFSYDDGESWSFAYITTLTFRYFEAAPGEIKVRVAGVSRLAQGPWIYGTITLTSLQGLDVVIPWDGLEWKVAWWDDFNVDKFQVKVYDNSGGSPILKRTEEIDPAEYLYNYTKALLDGNVVREHRVEVDVMVIDPETLILTAYELPEGLDLSNSIPEPPLHADVEFVEESSGWSAFLYRFFWDTPAEGDLITVKLWVSTTQGFNPAVVSPVATFTASTPGYLELVEEFNFEFALSAGNVHPDVYWRVGLFDVWGNEVSTNLTEEMALLPAWLLEGGEWADAGRWRDDENWQDS